MTLQTVPTARVGSAAAPSDLETLRVAPVSSKVRYPDGGRVERDLTTSTARLWVGGDGIACCALRTFASENLRTAHENLAALSRLCRRQRVRLLVDLRLAREISREALAFWWSTRVEPVVTSVALVVGVGSAVPKGPVFLSLPRSKIPVRLFPTDGEAVQWLDATGD